MLESKLSPLFKLRNYIIDNWDEDKRYTMGRILTIIDASIADKEQRKAIKDLIKSIPVEENYRMDEVCRILVNFSEKYCPKVFPETKELLNSFLGVNLPEGERYNPDYFAD